MTEYYPSERQTALFDPAHARLAQLIELIEPVAKRRPEQKVDAVTLAAARVVLRDVGRMTARLPVGRLLPLHAPLTALGLVAVLRHAEAALDLFAERYREFNNRTLEYEWTTREAVDEGEAEVAARKR